ncbi:hypothetical protein RHSIM_Rhsim05G0110200 [Rhododendron simsii]|uniref:Uncharacterized protein n=1 Tax=Rhododendron simsii TaxID=118357 RepID=A0A834LN36_RHOSS|nr:hypothetical protein RHSIM_Rhsim05G0110200 [Rhododendron simsii]
MCIQRRKKLNSTSPEWNGGSSLLQVKAVGLLKGKTGTVNNGGSVFDGAKRLRLIFKSNDSSLNLAQMKGFVQQAFNKEVEGMARTVMSGFKPELVPVYTELANEFAVFDQWFASVPEST